MIKLIPTVLSVLALGSAGTAASSGSLAPVPFGNPGVTGSAVAPGMQAPGVPSKQGLRASTSALSASGLPSGPADCSGLPSHEALRTALISATHQLNGGLSNEMWGSIVNRDGFVCAVAYSGDARGDQWPGSRVISAQKANTATSFSLPVGKGGLFPGLALSTANLITQVQPGGSLFGLQFSNPVDTGVAYGGDPVAYGQANDPMIGHRIGGVNVFGGGVALYDSSGRVMGGLGVSGDTSCTDHNIGWKTRHRLKLDYVPNGLSARTDNIIYDYPSNNIGPPQRDISPSGFGHPMCDPPATAVGNALPVTDPVSH